jgi:CheY-like chemotaxis protein
VRDTGPGIPPELVGRVFERFTRGTDGATAHAAGAGLGLSIVRGIVHAMGGDVDVRSVVGVGSVFTFEIVLDEVEEVQAAPAPSLPARSFPVRALVVEDNPVNRLVARAMLEKLGCQVEVAEDGRLGCQLAMHRRFDIVFMDCAMPVMDGYEATRALRSASGATPICVPIVAMTADVMPSTREACLRAGMTAVVAKPTTLEALDAMIAELCGDRAPGGGVGPVLAPNGAEEPQVWAAGAL